ncbi:hypothetical protein PRZ48_000751 [Zasmidium cellare]|uniref:Phosphatidic acid phosphatase type 2/haloperoxidase domain-containing protein n=1 Tax=Zasmidium cellare TaxID=395010 RepID=A0ABR0EZM5_ZASCE|nr:hypothetical protein PRZ48_000751 [Zasmidium cellare]
MPTSESSRTGAKYSKSPPNSNNNGYLDAFLRFARKTHAADYIGLSILVVGELLLKLFGEPFHAQFRLDDPRIQHPHAEVERVSVVWLMLYAAVIPIVVLIIWAIALRPSIHATHVTFLGLVIAVITTSFLTDLFKDAIGRPRPDLLARCKPESGTPKNEMVTIDVCTETNHHTLHDGWRSYPSGHSSFAFAGLGWVALLLASQTHVLRPRANMTVVLLCLVPLLGAALIAISRLEDYRHDVFDVVSGSLLGMAVTYFNWRRYYPSLLSSTCHEPYSIPTGDGRSSPTSGFQRIRDEEEGYELSPVP